MLSVRKDSLLFFNKLFTSTERVIQFASLLDDTQNQGHFSALLSGLAWLNVTDNCLLSHNTSWAHARGTQGFPPRQPEEQRRSHQTAWGKMYSSSVKSAAAGSRWFGACLRPPGARLVMLISDFIHKMFSGDNYWVYLILSTWNDKSCTTTITWMKHFFPYNIQTFSDMKSQTVSYDWSKRVMTSGVNPVLGSVLIAAGNLLIQSIISEVVGLPQKNLSEMIFLTFKQCSSRSIKPGRVNFSC